MTGCQNREIVPGMALSRADVTYPAVPVIAVVPAHEAGRPGARLVEIGKTPG